MTSGGESTHDHVRADIIYLADPGAPAIDDNRLSTGDWSTGCSYANGTSHASASHLTSASCHARAALDTGANC